MSALNRRKPMLALLLLTLVISDVIAVPLRLSGLAIREKSLTPYPLLLSPASVSPATTHRFTDDPSATPGSQAARVSPLISPGPANTITLRAPDGGPGAPEVQAFTPASVSEMVDPFTGDFTYNIPLLDVGGYPVNLAYNSGIGLNDEASWVGLGWSLNPGAINRQVRGLPDDFKGDLVHRKAHMKDNKTGGGTITLGAEYYGFGTSSGGMREGLSTSFGATFNSYKGWALSIGMTPSLTASASAGSHKLSGALNLTAGINSQNGSYFDPQIGLGHAFTHNKHTVGTGVEASLGISSEEGVKFKEFGASWSYQWEKAKRHINTNLSHRPEGGESHKGHHGSFSLGFAAPTFTPAPEIPRRTELRTFGARIGGAIYGIHLNFSLSGFYTNQQLDIPASGFDQPGYGFLYAQDATESSLLDCNREKDGAFDFEKENLSVANFTCDLYQATGQGIGGQFRPFRGDRGTLYDPYTRSNAGGPNINLEVGVGNLTHVGVDATGNVNFDETKKWTNGNGLNEAFRFQGTLTDNPAYEPVYFKNVGELTALENESLFDNLGGFGAVQPIIHDPSIVEDGSCRNQLSNGMEFEAPEQTRLTKRESRNTLFSYLTAQEVVARGPRPTIEYWGESPGVLFDYRSIPRVDLEHLESARKPHHISEITVTRDDGAAYVYGIPAYNLSQQETAFNISGRTPEHLEGIVTYESDEVGTRGYNQYFSEIKTPPYASSFLLTEIRSPDYVDVNANGPDPVDQGSYTQFHYTLKHERFGWRSPDRLGLTDQLKAHFQGGNESDTEDDMAHFTWGEKEIWYLKGIESKNFLALFFFSDRDDAQAYSYTVYGAPDQPSTKRLQKLDSILLVSKAEFVNNPDGSWTPVRTVHFEYSNELCFDRNMGQGKLTLKKVWFENGDSKKGRRSPYVFHYDFNPEYGRQNADRWGNYKPNRAEEGFDNERFPFSEQDPETANRNASAWQLSAIDLPNGGTLRIDYESDAYAYVQDRKAMRMYPVSGFSNDRETAPGMELSGKNRLYFQLPQPIPDLDINRLLPLFEGVNQLYFNARLSMGEGVSEFVEGFIPWQLSAMTGPANFGFANAETAWLDLELYNGHNPVQRALWEKIHKEIPHKRDSPNRTALTEGFAIFEELGVQIERLGRNRDDDYNTTFIGDSLLPGSFIRLNANDGIKYGGGSRVQRIVLEDNWGTMTADPAQDYFYGQEYFYTKQEDGIAVSSGVASYEPLIGGAENPFKRMASGENGHWDVEKKGYSVSLNFDNLEPLGESFLPAAGVGYGSVTIRNLQRPGVTRTATGYTEQEFYTAKDFPVKISKTPILCTQKDFYAPAIFYTRRENSATVSQGIAVELNNMHGRPKAVSIYNEQGILISAQRHRYKSDDRGLVSRGPALSPEDNTFRDRLIGVDYDFYLDAREFLSETHGYGAHVNTEGFLAATIPFYVPTILPDISEGISRYKGITATKVIYRSGIPDATEVYDQGARIITYNRLFDGATGQVLLTETTNEFDEPYFALQLPAWRNPAYAGMGPACNNNGITLNDAAITGGWFPQPEAANYFKQGDYLFCRRSVPEASPAAAWVWQVEDNRVLLIGVDGQPLPDGTYHLKILRPAHRNQMSAVMGSYLSSANPAGAGNRLDVQEERVLEASVQSFSQYWQAYRPAIPPTPQLTCPCLQQSESPESEHFRENMRRLLSRLFSNPGLLNNRALMSLNGLDPARFLWADYPTYQGVFNGTALFGTLTSAGGNTCRFTAHLADDRPFPTSEVSRPELVFDGFANTEIGCRGFARNAFYFRVMVNDEDVARLRVVTNCIETENCAWITTYTPANCSPESGVPLNPFVNSLLGHWRPNASWKFVGQRSSNPLLKNSGYYVDFRPFWDAGTFSQLEENKIHWQRADSITLIDPKGNVLETQNALGLPSATLFGYKLNLPVAAAANARHRDVAFDGFEDYYYLNAPPGSAASCGYSAHWMLDIPYVDEELPDHDPYFRYFEALGSKLDDAKSHTGRYSVMVNRSDDLHYVRNLIDPGETAIFDPGARLSEPAFRVHPKDRIGAFNPAPGKYLLNAWVHENAIDTGFTHSWIDISLSGGAPERIFPTGPVIDGWQQINTEITIRDGETSIQVRLGSDAFSWFDDLRIQPFHATMETYVYHPELLRLMAVLDTENHATFYEYDEEGNLARTKKETERGIFTLQEVRSGKPLRP